MSSTKARRPDLTLSPRPRREFIKGDVVRLRTQTSPSQVRLGTATVVLTESTHPDYVLVNPLAAPPPYWEGLWIRRWRVSDLVLVTPTPTAPSTTEENR